MKIRFNWKFIKINTKNTYRENIVSEKVYELKIELYVINDNSNAVVVFFLVGGGLRGVVLGVGCFWGCWIFFFLQMSYHLICPYLLSWTDSVINDLNNLRFFFFNLIGLMLSDEYLNSWHSVLRSICLKINIFSLI